MEKLEKAPLLNESTGDSNPNSIADSRTSIHQVLNQAFTSSAHLANLLPTGTLLAFQFMGSTVSNNGQCDSVARSVTETLLILCAISCLVMSFTDSFRGADGKIYYGFATLRGLWAFDYPSTEIPDAAKYRLRFVDFVHAFLSVLTFVAIALYDQNIISCFYPAPGYLTMQVLRVLPVGIGLISSLFFVLFPTTRHGIGYPVTT